MDPFNYFSFRFACVLHTITRCTAVGCTLLPHGTIFATLKHTFTRRLAGHSTQHYSIPTHPALVDATQDTTQHTRRDQAISTERKKIPLLAFSLHKKHWLLSLFVGCLTLEEKPSSRPEAQQTHTAAFAIHADDGDGAPTGRFFFKVSSRCCVNR